MSVSAVGAPAGSPSGESAGGMSTTRRHLAAPRILRDQGFYLDGSAGRLPGEAGDAGR